MTVSILIGDVRERLRGLPDESVHCVVTSPPYWGLRDYGTGRWEGGDPGCLHEPVLGRGGGDPSTCRHCGARKVDRQIGMEPTYQEHIQVLVEVFREVRRVLRSDGTLWLNYGDCWASTPNGRSAAEGKETGLDDRSFRDKPFSTVGGALKPKDLAMLPHRLAIALQEDGWWVRSDIVWHKPNPMPSSVKDRPTPSKEYLFLLTKAPRYYYDHVAILEPLADPAAVYKMPDGRDTGDGAHGTVHRAGREKGKVSSKYSFGRAKAKGQDVPGQKPQFRPGRDDVALNPAGRNKRDVWTIATEPFSEAHFATFPTALAEPCILAGTSAAGVCQTCGAPWRKKTETQFAPQADAPNSFRREKEQTAPEVGWAGSRRGTVNTTTTGWEPSCKCPPALPVPATVLDPFGGAGTAGLVADRLGRNAVLIELNEAYAAMARQRIERDGGLFSCVETRAAE
jgi:DNA modification methylase